MPARLKPGEGKLATNVARIIKKHKLATYNRGMFEFVGDHYYPLDADGFEELIRRELGAEPRNHIQDVMRHLLFEVRNLTPNASLINLGGVVWDTSLNPIGPALLMTPEDAPWYSPYAPSKKTHQSKFLLDLSMGDEGVYDDLLQSISPLLLNRRPDGVIWWVGSGANGKSSLMDALYRLFPDGQLCSLTVKGMEDERDVPMINRAMANIVRESNDGHISDSRIYKSLATHEDFYTHQNHQHFGQKIQANKHHIFSANQIPTFSDKGDSALRRTHVIEFRNKFVSDPMFNDKTFTDDFLSHLMGEIVRAAIKVQLQGYRYSFSEVTQITKANYDAEANNAQEYFRELKELGVVVFESYEFVDVDYKNWCRSQSYPALGEKKVRAAGDAAGFSKKTMPVRITPNKWFRHEDYDSGKEITPLALSRPGFYTYPTDVAREVELIFGNQLELDRQVVYKDVSKKKKEPKHESDRW